MNRTMVELAWVAGFLEGEGSFRHPISKATTLTISASQVQREPLERLHNSFSGSLLLKPRGKSATGREQPIFVWTLTGNRAAGLMMTLYTFLSPRRRGQVREALRRWRSRKPQSKYRTHCVAGHSYSSENTRIYTNPRTGKTGRWCRACKRERYAERYVA